MTRIRHLQLLLISTLAASCAATGDDLSPALETMTVDGLAAHIAVLSSDSFGGRAPSTEGERLTLEYLTREFSALGLEPGNHGSFLQEVPLVEITADPAMSLHLRGDGVSTTYSYGDEFVAWTNRVVPETRLADSELVFVGYGVVAPEFGWNDYEGLDVAGRTVVILVNDPGFATRDEALFGGLTMTYYGRWTYKYEEAARQGAAGAIVVHEAEPAGYPWEVVRTGWTGPRFGLADEGTDAEPVPVEAWITGDVARDIFRSAGQDFEALKSSAAERGFRPVPLGLRASVEVRNTIRHSSSSNVLALLRGSERPEEVILYSAHWDHMGTQGGEIYNGARDNASGTAAILELAKAFTTLERRPARSVLFLAVTAEEQGLLGSAYYAANPVFPTTRTVAAINIDGLNIWGPMRDVTIIGYGNSELDGYLREAASAEGRSVRPEPEPEKGFYYRSDHFSFAKVGIPALYTDSGIDHVEHGEAWTLAQRERWIAENYHKPTDVMDESWDLRGGIDDLRLFFRVGHRLATGTSYPNWSEGNEFRAVRDEDLARRH
jgi:Zn-dependent M28 family amino/carboxypeptidase